MLRVPAPNSIIRNGLQPGGPPADAQLQVRPQVRRIDDWTIWSREPVGSLDRLLWPRHQMEVEGMAAGCTVIQDIQTCNPVSSEGP